MLGDCLMLKLALVQLGKEIKIVLDNIMNKFLNAKERN